MKTATLDVGGMLSMLDYQAVEKQIGRIPGVQRATASIASNSVTVECDETVTSVAALKNKVNECGFHCTGQIMPKHVCEPHPGMPVSRGAPMKLAGSRPFSAAARTMAEPHLHAPAGVPAAATPAVPISHDMAHDMGHGAGMDMQAMVRGMRNRFWISLVFSVPIFAYSPMGMDFVRLKPPFGLDRFITEGAIFRRIFNKRAQRTTDRRLAPRNVAAIVKQGAARLGFDPSTFGGHSLRAGFVTSAVKRGASLIKITDVTGHKSLEMLKTYSRDAEAFVGHAGAGLF
jgi:copper chaperone CopZ